MSSTSFGWGKGEKVTAAGWQVTLCDPIWNSVWFPIVVWWSLITNCYMSALLYLHLVKIWDQRKANCQDSCNARLWFCFAWSRDFDAATNAESPLSVWVHYGDRSVIAGHCCCTLPLSDIDCAKCSFRCTIMIVGVFRGAVKHGERTRCGE